MHFCTIRNETRRSRDFLVISCSVTKRTCIHICSVYNIYIIIIIIIIIQLFHNHTITSIIMYKNMLYLQVKIMLSQPFECLVSHALHFYGSWCLECPTEFSHGNDSMDWLKRKTTRGNHAFYH